MARACVTHEEDEECIQNFSNRKVEARRILGGTRHRHEDDIKNDLKETGYKGVDWIHLDQDRVW
jgi:hypothetical protein